MISAPGSSTECYSFRLLPKIVTLLLASFGLSLALFPTLSVPAMGVTYYETDDGLMWEKTYFGAEIVRAQPDENGHVTIPAEIDGNPVVSVFPDKKGQKTIKSIDVSQCDKLEYLEIYDMELTELDVRNNKELVILGCAGNNLTELDLSNQTKITQLFCGWNKLTSDSLILPKAKAMDTFSCSNNKLTTLDLSGCPNLEVVGCSNNKLEKLVLPKKLMTLDCDNNRLTSLDLSDMRGLDRVECFNNKLEKLVLKKNKCLLYLDCRRNLLTKIDLSQCPKLFEFYAQNNQLKSLDLTKANVGEVYCNNNKLRSIKISKSKNKRLLTAGTLNAKGNLLSAKEKKRIDSLPWFLRDSRHYL